MSLNLFKASCGGEFYMFLDEDDKWTAMRIFASLAPDHWPDPRDCKFTLTRASVCDIKPDDIVSIADPDVEFDLAEAKHEYEIKQRELDALAAMPSLFDLEAPANV